MCGSRGVWHYVTCVEDGEHGLNRCLGPTFTKKAAWVHREQVGRK